MVLIQRDTTIEWLLATASGTSSTGITLAANCGDPRDKVNASRLCVWFLGVSAIEGILATSMAERTRLVSFHGIEASEIAAPGGASALA